MRRHQRSRPLKGQIWAGEQAHVFDSGPMVGMETSVTFGDERGKDSDTILSRSMQRHMNRAAMICNRCERGQPYSQRLVLLSNLANLEADIQALLPRRSGQPNIAPTIVQSGHVASFGEAFDRSLGPEKGVPVLTQCTDAEAASTFQHRASGIRILAHSRHHTPHAIAASFIDASLDRLESIHFAHDESVTGYSHRVARYAGVAGIGWSGLHDPGNNLGLGWHSIPCRWDKSGGTGACASTSPA